LLLDVPMSTPRVHRMSSSLMRTVRPAYAKSISYAM